MYIGAIKSQQLLKNRLIDLWEEEYFIVGIVLCLLAHGNNKNHLESLFLKWLCKMHPFIYCLHLKVPSHQ